MKVLVFDIWGDYGHFRKFYTTSSPLTFSFPPPPTVYGLLGAISGKDKMRYLDIFNEKTKIGIQFLKPIRKVRMGINLVETKGTGLKRPLSCKNPRTQILTEFVKEPRYRIFVSHTNDGILSDLAEKIKGHKTIYTISLGLSELLADFSFIGLVNAEEKQNTGFIDIFTVVPFSLIQRNGVKVEEGKKYIKEKIPAEMKPERIVTRYEDVLFDIDGKSLQVNVQKYWELENGTKITFI